LLELRRLVAIRHAQRVQVLGAAHLELGHPRGLLDSHALRILSARSEQEILNFHNLLRLHRRKTHTHTSSSVRALSSSNVAGVTLTQDRVGAQPRRSTASRDPSTRAPAPRTHTNTHNASIHALKHTHTRILIAGDSHHRRRATDVGSSIASPKHHHPSVVVHPRRRRRATARTRRTCTPAYSHTHAHTHRAHAHAHTPTTYHGDLVACVTKRRIRARTTPSTRHLLLLLRVCILPRNGLSTA